ncbi:MAG: formimidoylglutamase [Cardiobacteriaceae bacterium]|nr:formimidoylglutamase [Cardiobacteriaceae bacterium]
MDIWQGRNDHEEGEGGKRWHQVMQSYDGTQKTALLGFACDAGVARNQGRIGAAEGPDALRKMLANLPVLRRVPADAGNIVCQGDALEAAQAAYADQVAAMIRAGTLPIGLGGGHEIAFAAGIGLHQALPDARLGIINIDAHLDVRIDARPSSGTPFRQLADAFSYRYACLGASRFANTRSLFARAENMGAWVVEDTALLDLPWLEVEAEIRHFINTVDAIYLTLDLDVLPAAVMPAVSAPAAFGLPLPLVEKMVRVVLASGKVRLCDVAEYNPRYDIDGHGARTAARLVALMAGN